MHPLIQKTEVKINPKYSDMVRLFAPISNENRIKTIVKYNYYP